MDSLGKSLALLLVFLFLASLVTVQPVSVKADSPKTIAVPDDYTTIQSAINKASAGDTIFVKKGIYEEHSLTIDKSITVIGENSDNTIIKDIDLPTQFFDSSLFIGPTAISIGADNVRISGLTISSNGTAIGGGGFKTLITDNKLDSITLDKGSYQTIADNIVTSINCRVSFTYIVNNTLKASYSVITVQTPSNDNVIYNNKVKGVNTTSNLDVAGINGIYVSDSSNNLIAKNAISNGGVGILIDLSSSSNNVVANTVFNGFVGLAAIRESKHNMFYANTVENNTSAIAIAGTGNLFYDNNFLNNSKLLENADRIVGPNPSTSNTFWNNGNQGNFWSDYLTKYPEAVEINKTGIGNTPYVIDASNVDKNPLFSPFDQEAIISFPQWLPPLISFVSPEYQKYNADKIDLKFTINNFSSLSYSVDWKENVSIAGNTTVENLSNGLHSVTLYANDIYGNTFSQTIAFTVEKSPLENIGNPLIIATIAIPVAILFLAIGLLFYTRRRKTASKQKA